MDFRVTPAGRPEPRRLGRPLHPELDAIVRRRGRPQTILGSSPRTSDNGTEPTSNVNLTWADDLQIG